MVAVDGVAHNPGRIKSVARRCGRVKIALPEIPIPVRRKVKRSRVRHDRRKLLSIRIDRQVFESLIAGQAVPPDVVIARVITRVHRPIRDEIHPFTVRRYKRIGVGIFPRKRCTTRVAPRAVFEVRPVDDAPRCRWAAPGTVPRNPECRSAVRGKSQPELIFQAGFKVREGWGSCGCRTGGRRTADCKTRR